MKRLVPVVLILGLVFCHLTGCSSSRLNQAAASITEEELKTHLEFLASDEFRGRNTPSPELKIASRYLAVLAERSGLQPLLPEGTYLQEIKLVVTEADRTRTRIQLRSGTGIREFSYGQDFGLLGRGLASAQVSDRVLFLGLGLSASESGWDDIGSLNLKDRIVLVLDPELPESHVLMQEDTRRLLRRRSGFLIQQGAAAVLTVVSEAREQGFQNQRLGFAEASSVRLSDTLKSMVSPGARRPSLRAELRHAMAALLLGISQVELNTLFSDLKGGKQVAARELPQARLDIRVEVRERPDKTCNVVGYVEGTDELLKEEYVLIGSHHDHIGAREGRVYNGADDNGSGTVAMLEIAQALSLKRPQRSVVLVWHTGEEKGLWGARYFVERGPLSAEKISAVLNLDMICRNEPDHLYLIGSRTLSSQLDAVLQSVNEKRTLFRFDYMYEDIKHPDFFFFRSDHFPYIQYGIPGVWLFCGTTEDYHQVTDTVDRVDYGKMARVARLTYRAALEIGDMPGKLSLDAHPQISSRGEHNLAFQWR